VANGASAPGAVQFEADGGISLQAWATHPPHGNEDCVAVRTAYIDMARGANGRPNTAAGTIRQRLFHGDFIQYLVDWPAGQLTIRRPPTEIFEEGAEVALSFAAAHCVLLER
jgi:ABC-type Fe3+/spermidine/putrescine transport system ATPase subunit